MSASKTEDAPKTPDAPGEAPTETPKSDGETPDTVDGTKIPPPTEAKTPATAEEKYAFPTNKNLTVTQEIIRRAQKFAKKGGEKMHIRRIPLLMSHLGCLFNKPELQEIMDNIPQRKFINEDCVKVDAVCKIIARRIKTRMYEPPPNSEIVRVLELLNVDGDRLVDWEEFKKLVEETMPDFGPEDLDIFKLEMVNLFGQVSLCCLLTHCLPTSDDFSIYKYMDEIAGRVQVDPDEDDLSVDKISRNEEDGDENGELNA